MIAYYAEEHWPYESTTARLYMTTVDDYHRVAAVRAGMNTIDWYYAPCEPGRPFFRKDGATYLPISQARCVWWDADSIEVISFAEWDEIVGTVRSVTPCPLLERSSSARLIHKSEMVLLTIAVQRQKVQQPLPLSD